MENDLRKINYINLDKEIFQNVKDALTEDLGQNFQIFASESHSSKPMDLTGSIIDRDKIGRAKVVSKEEAIFCGKLWFERVYGCLNRDIQIDWKVSDGQQMKPHKSLCEIKGPVWAILAGERTALNFVQTLSGTATSTSELVNLLGNSSAKILDTRKTIPGLRMAQKYAVLCGGGFNHRLGLFDEILVKENHIAAEGGIERTLKKLKERFPGKLIEIEVENLSQLHEVLKFGADIVLLDNFSFEDILKAIKIINNRMKVEVSGNIKTEQLKQFAQLEIDYISIGALTKNVRAVDLSMIMVDVT